MLWLLLDIALAGPVVTGIVVDAKGRPVEGIHIDNISRTATSNSTRTDVYSDSQGRFAVPWPGETDTKVGAPMLLAMLQARTEDGRSSEMVYPTSFPAEVRLQLREPAELSVKLDGDWDRPPAKVTVHARTDRGSLLGNGGWIAFEGEAAVKKRRVDLGAQAPGEVSVFVSAGSSRGFARGRLEPGEKLELDVTLGQTGRVGLFFDHDVRAGVCLIEPGRSWDAGRGMPTAETCWKVDPWHHAVDDLVPGLQTLTVKLDDGRVLQRRFEVRPGEYCAYPELAWAENAPQGIVGVRLPVDGRESTVESVVAGTPAEAAGIAVGDRILAVNDVSVASGLDATIAIRMASESRPVKIEVDRGGERLELRVEKIPVRPPPLMQATECGEPPARPEPEYREPYGLPIGDPPPLDMQQP